MHLTQEHIGKVLCLYQTGERIRITAVDQSYVHYEREYGSHYVSHSHTADAFIEPDAVRCTSFERNYKLGNVLVSAELKAHRMIHGGESTPEMVAEGQRMLGVIHSQQKHLMDNIDRLNATECPHPALVSAFLSQLYELGNGSHDTFFGHRVESISSHTAIFRVDGQALDYDLAMGHLCEQTLQPRSKSSLDDIIHKADNRRQKNPFTIEPKAVTDHEI